jgi:3-deoxy-D-manno-octulosonic-acid transferase
MLLLFFYRILYLPLLIFIHLVSWFHPKLRQGLKLRKSVQGKKPWLNFTPQTKPIWIHCASGEFEYAKPVIREIKKQDPKVKIMVTYFSPSVENSIKNFPGVDFYCPTPWDSMKEWQEFIDFHRPQALLIARTDLWPAMIFSAKKYNIPRLLFSKTVNEKKKQVGQFISLQLMKNLNDIFCVSPRDRELLYEKIKPYQNIYAIGDTRYDQCLYRIQNAKVLKPLNNFNKSIFVAGSTWPKDEETLMPVIEKLINEISFILAPHEPTIDHLKKITQQLDKLKIKHQFYSKIQSWDPQAVLIIDQVGILADLYSWSQMSFIGGSMDRSVHSVLEPLAHGNLCFVGPNHYNNREALLFKETPINGISPVQSIETSQELEQKIKANLPLWNSIQRFELQHLVKKNQGASLQVLKWLQKHMLSSL